MFTVTQENIPALRRVMIMARDAIFDGTSVDSMSPTFHLIEQRDKCRAFLAMVNEFNRNMEPGLLSADDIDRVCERLNFVTQMLGDWIQEH
jgi:hypothetical protein